MNEHRLFMCVFTYTIILMCVYVYIYINYFYNGSSNIFTDSENTIMIDVLCVLAGGAGGKTCSNTAGQH